MEEVVTEVARAVDKEPASIPFPRMTHQEAMDRYGTDKPDIRFAMEFFNLGAVAAECGFKVFSGTVSSGGTVLGITAPSCASYSRKEIDILTAFVQERGAKGLAWFKCTPDGLASPIAKFFTQEEQGEIIRRAGASEGDLILIVAAPLKTARAALSDLRTEIAKRLDLMGEGLAFCWITEFPMFEEDEETGELVPSHHPFTMPKEEYEGHLEKDPKNLNSKAYDLVLNGVELGSGSVRIHQRELQSRIFTALKINEERAREKFGFLLDAFEYGAPPHAGIALGLDRLVMILAGVTNIREVIAFPKTASGGCPLTGAPTSVDEDLLSDLGLALKKAKRT
jgi:aspartyl-tRNA synthetase